MNIRGYLQTDTENLLNILKLNIPEFFASEEEMEFVKYLEEDSQNYYVIESGNQIVGSGGFNLFPESKTARISWDIIHPDYHRKGYGSLLTEHRINEIKKNDNINLIVVRTSQHANKFYEKFGFQTSEIIKNYWAKGFHLYHMQINL